MTTSEESNPVSKTELPVKAESKLRMVQQYEGKKVVLPSYLNLKNELVFAEYDLSLSASKLLYFAMAHFDSTEFYADSDVLKHKGKLSKVEPSVYSNIYEGSTSRTIIIPAAVLMSVIRGRKRNSKSKNYEPLYNAITQFSGATITINTKKNEKVSSDTFPFFDKVEAFVLELDSDRKQIFVMLTFTVKYMPFVIACSGFTKLSFDAITRLSSVNAMRYYHWFHYALKSTGKGRFSIFQRLF